ncbi:phosphoglycerate mutase family protein [Robertmurraya sp. DFI.2.37]|uniref:histidine phosphatase family protein n=1 Tax=Robertmurraya sp. DFI.2.37 TaxID=3031819 RepID=UPI0023DB657E|nr:phosphoglycerate mutase family protein [Robertmurraya sp. DFI.2.37]MDF1510076.1 phosphoglycerate mutase family protein [Robertmurraya sp. DFI.2.37]
MDITVIRHLPTEWNIKQKLQGKRDIPILSLTEKQHLNIAKNTNLLMGKSFDHVLCSSLLRTKQTAERYGYTAVQDALLDELDFGPFEGRPKEDLLCEFGELWIEHPQKIVLGESLSNLEKRIISFLNKYNNAAHLLVFGHGSWIRALSSYHRFGHINAMNKMTVNNNECISLEFITVEI